MWLGWLHATKYMFLTLHLSALNVVCNSFELAEVWLLHAEVGTVCSHALSIFLQSTSGDAQLQPCLHVQHTSMSISLRAITGCTWNEPKRPNIHP